MKIETIRKSHKKSIIACVVAFIVIAIVLIVGKSFAKYNLVKSIKIAEGTINYKVPDFKIMAMYQQKANQTCTNDSCYEEITSKRMPTSGYVINETKSYCSLDNINKDKEARLYTNENGEHIISNLAKASKCYLYFDKKSLCNGIGCNMVLENVAIKEGTPDFSKVATTDEGIYKVKDESGKDSYYWRGAVENNYVRFAGYWWRIIRINGDGSIRMIYDGTSGHTNSTNTSDSIAVASQTFNANYNDNAYVGFKYTIGQLRGLNTKSNVLTQLETWYTRNLSSYASKIDTNAGFCGDRTPSTDLSYINNEGGTGTTSTYYASYIRLVDGKTPDLTCANSSDFYTVSSSNKGNKSLIYPIGLITADEVSLAGGVNGKTNSSYYLYNGQHYWTLSPFILDSYGVAKVFIVYSSSFLEYNVFYSLGIRPVINLKANTTLTGKGTISSPYVVQ